MNNETNFLLNIYLLFIIALIKITTIIKPSIMLEKETDNPVGIIELLSTINSQGNTIDKIVLTIINKIIVIFLQ